jgi:hypothetical protein
MSVTDRSAENPTDALAPAVPAPAKKKKHAITSEASHKLVRSVAQEIGLQAAENRPRIETLKTQNFTQSETETQE